MGVQRSGQVRERTALRAVIGISREVGCAIADRVVASCADAPAFCAPSQQLLAYIAKLCTQVTRTAARAACGARATRAVLMQVIADRQQQSLGFWFGHRSMVARRASRVARAS